MALDTVVENINSPGFENSVGAKDADVAFLSELMNNTVVQSLIKVCIVMSKSFMHVKSVSTVIAKIITGIPDKMSGHSCFPCRTFYVYRTLLVKMSGKV